MMSTSRSRSASRRLTFYWGEVGVLLLQFTDAGRFVGVHAVKAGAPAVEGVLRDVVLAADFGDGFVALFGLLQNGDDLLVGELALLHVSILPFGWIFLRKWYSLRGTSHPWFHS